MVTSSAIVRIQYSLLIDIQILEIYPKKEAFIAAEQSPELKMIEDCQLNFIAL